MGGGRKGPGGDMGYLGGYMGSNDDRFEGLGSPMSDIGSDHTQQMNGINGEGDDVSCGYFASLFFIELFKW